MSNLAYSLGLSITSSHVIQHVATSWADFSKVFDAPNDVRSKEKGGRYICWPMVGEHRSKCEAAPANWIAFDFDSLSPATRDALLLWFQTHFQCLIYETASSSPEQPRLRVIVALDRTVTPGERRLLCKAVGGRVAHLAQRDPCQDLASQPAFLPLLGVAVVQGVGTPLPVAAWMALAAPENPATEPAPPTWTDGPCAEWRGPADDDELLRRALSARPTAQAAFGGGASFADLWTANEATLSKCFPTFEHRADGLPYDASRADAAAAAHLAFWTGRNCERIERLMWRSALAREKWERRDYLVRTITGAVARCEEVLASPSSTREEVTPHTQAGVELLQGSHIAPEPIRWLWPGWLAQGKLHVVAGQPGTGKTSISLALAATVTAGGRWPDGTGTERGNVLVWSGEDDPRDTLIPRLMASGAEMSRCFFVGDVHDHAGRRPFDPAKDIDSLKEASTRIGNIRLLIVDPIVSAVAGDSHKNAETRRGLAPLVELAARLDCALLGISHFTKGTAGRDPLERVTGSLAFGALARIVFAAFKRSEEDGGGRCFCRVKSNIGPDDGGFAYTLQQRELPAHPGVMASHVAWGGAIAGAAKDMLARAEADPQGEDTSAIAEAVEFLRGVLAEGPVAAYEAQRAAREQGISAATLRRAKTKLRVACTRSGFGPGSIISWMLPVITDNYRDAQ